MAKMMIPTQRAVTRPTWRLHGRGVWGLFVVIGGLMACQDIQPVAPAAEPITDPMQLYTSLTLNHPAVNLSTTPGYDTLQLTATPRDLLGNAMPGLPAPTYTSSDTSKIRVTEEGFVTAVGTGAAVRVTAALTVGPVTRTATAWINVRDLPTPPELASLSIHPLPPDSAMRGVAEFTSFNPSTQLVFGAAGLFSQSPFTRLVPRAADITDTEIVGLEIAYNSLDPLVMSVRGDGRTPEWEETRLPGQARLVAQTYAYNIVKADTLTYTLTMPVTGSKLITLDANGAPSFQTHEVSIRPNGIVGWFNDLDDSVDVTFDNPADVVAPTAAVCDAVTASLLPLLFFFPTATPQPCGAGNALVPSSPSGPSGGHFDVFKRTLTLRLRQFPAEGIYTYRSIRTGATGRIIVTADPFAD